MEHSVGVNKCIISIFSLIDSHLKLFLNLLVRGHLLLQPGILSLSLLFLLIILILLILRIILILIFILIMVNNIKLMFWSLIVQCLQNHIGKFWLVLFSFNKLIVIIYVSFVRIGNKKRSQSHFKMLKIVAIFVFVFTWLTISNRVWALSDMKLYPSTLFPVQVEF